METTLVHQPQSTASRTEARLASWKEIADYLGRSPRTVQRWLVEYGLPVRRLGGSSGPIFAYKDELDRWLRNRGQATYFQSPYSSEPTAPGPVVVSPSQANSTSYDLQPVSGLRTNRSAELTSVAQEMWETSSTADFGTAIRAFRDAIDLDPGNSSALAGLSFVLLAGSLLGSLNNPIYATTAEDALRRAVEIDPSSVSVLNARAWMKMSSAHNWQAARRYFSEALAHNPLFGPALVGRALLYIAEGSLAEASDLLLEASSQTPLSAPTAILRCWNAYLGGQTAVARSLIAQARLVGHSGPVLDAFEALCLLDRDNPDSSLDHILALAAQPKPHPLLLGVLGYCYAVAGQTHDAQVILQNFMQSRATGRQDFGYPLALVFLGLHDRPNAMRWIKQAYMDGSLWSLGFNSDPLLASLRNDNLFQTQWASLIYSSPQSTDSRLASAS